MKTYTIGRDLGCDIVINDNTDVVSRRHAVLTVGTGGKMTITDLSSNGTYVNGIKIAPNVPFPVSRKDSVSFAHVANLDWDVIPKSRRWITWLIVGLVVAVIAAFLAVFFTRPPQPKPETDVVTDTTQLVQPADSLQMDSIAPTPADTVKEQPATPGKPKAKDKKKENKEEAQPAEPVKEEKPSADSSVNLRPIGV